VYNIYIYIYVVICTKQCIVRSSVQYVIWHDVILKYDILRYDMRWYDIMFCDMIIYEHTIHWFRWTFAFISSSLSINIRTLLPNFCAATANLAAVNVLNVSFPPNPPPIRFTITLTFDAGRPKTPETVFCKRSQLYVCSSIVLYCIVLYCVVLCCIVLYCNIISYHTISHHIISYHKNNKYNDDYNNDMI